MPSGFQQDANQLAPSFYRIVINMDNSTSTAHWPVWNASPQNDLPPTWGGVNPYNWDTFTTLPTTVNSGEAIARGNLRFQSIIEELSKFADAQILDIEVASTNITVADNQFSAIAFSVKYDRDSFILPSYQKLLLTESNNANTSFNSIASTPAVTTNILAIKDLVVRGICRSVYYSGGSYELGYYTKSYRAYNPVIKEGAQKQITIISPDVIAKVYADVTVTKIDGTELITTDSNAL